MATPWPVFDKIYQQYVTANTGLALNAAPDSECAAAAAATCAVVLACRSSSKGEAMVQQLTQEAAAAGRPEPKLEVNLLDLASLESVRQFVQRWQQRPLHVLVNNAGMFNMGGEAVCCRQPDHGRACHSSFPHGGGLLRERCYTAARSTTLYHFVLDAGELVLPLPPCSAAPVLQLAAVRPRMGLRCTCRPTT
jgi:hypothetical protein